MQTQSISLIITLVGVIILIWLLRQYQQDKPKGKNANITLMGDQYIHQILLDSVSFYTNLEATDQQEFLQRCKKFLQTVRLSNVGRAMATTADQWMVAAAAIIPVFNLKNWEYNNLDEVLLYPQMFNYGFEPGNLDSNIAGMVGEGALQRTMILSLPALRQGFMALDGYNTGIHEFVHLIDKTDGYITGVPQILLSQEDVAAWSEAVAKGIEKIKNGESPLNNYAATNMGEFFAVASEYFFEVPHILEEHHPEVAVFMEKMFRREIVQIDFTGDDDNE